MQAAVTQALRRVEIEVLQVVTDEQIAELIELQRSVRDAEDAVESLWASRQIVDVDYLDRHKKLTNEVNAARLRLSGRWRELFD